MWLVNVIAASSAHGQFLPWATFEISLCLLLAMMGTHGLRAVIRRGRWLERSPGQLATRVAGLVFLFAMTHTGIMELLDRGLPEDAPVRQRRQGDHYVALETMRFEDALQLRTDLNPATLVCPVPPMAVQTLVENAIKHGLAGRRATGDHRSRSPSAPGWTRPTGRWSWRWSTPAWEGSSRRTTPARPQLQPSGVESSKVGR